MIVLRILLVPFTFLYAIAIAIRNLLYQAGIFKRASFDFPVICVGNLAVGGTGKTPHIEWLVKKLGNQYNPAILSRGYKRKTKGYLLANAQSTPVEIGDEPYQMKQKFPEVAVAVCESRTYGISGLLKDVPSTQVILMDDGFQHLPVQPGYAILLTDYNNLYTHDWPMPSGTLREFRSGAQRAQCIIVSKCPADLTFDEREKIKQQLDPLPGQLVLFSKLKYGELKPVYNNPEPAPGNHISVLAFSGIARNALFANELNRRYKVEEMLSYSDHKHYDDTTLETIASRFSGITAFRKIMITTEKDAVKLNSNKARNILGNFPLYYLPVEVEFFDNTGEHLEQVLKQFIASFAV